MVHFELETCHFGPADARTHVLCIKLRGHAKQLKNVLLGAGAVICDVESAYFFLHDEAGKLDYGEAGDTTILV